MRKTSTLSLTILLCLGCMSDPKPAPAPGPAPVPSPELTKSEAVESTPPVVAPTDADRDPFVQQMVPKTPPPKNDLARKAKKYNVEQLRLVGIVGGEEQRAMLVDPRGKGWIVERGDRVGRAELRVDHFTGWRVERIRSEEVVLVREDPAHESEAAETRVLALHSAPEPLDMDD